ncbi:MAG: UDP-N-acetylglucosamine 2-epimerase (non-hydrolyzing) [Byssovorax sp.]
MEHRSDRTPRRRGIDLVVGTRPNLVKAAPILRAFAARGDAPPVRLVHTGQHYDPSMNDVLAEELGLPAPEVVLGVGSGPHGVQTAAMIAGYTPHLLGPDRPRGVVVVGDCTSTLAGALAAAQAGLPVAHVEAGLRSFDETMPEELNRRVTDAVSSLLFASEPSGVENLRREGVAEAKIRFTGNVMIDALVHALPAARVLDMPAALGLAGRPFAYLTLHRPSNVDDPARLAALVSLTEALAARVPVVFPVHPRTSARLAAQGLDARLAACAQIRCLGPQGYLRSLSLLAAAAVVITDSGGLQEESSFLGVPCFTLRPNTERPVTISHGTNTLIDGDLDRLLPLVEAALGGQGKRGGPLPGWDGDAAARVVEALLDAWAMW